MPIEIQHVNVSVESYALRDDYSSRFSPLDDNHLNVIIRIAWREIRDRIPKVLA
jgi:hypothetical protein